MHRNGFDQVIARHVLCPPLDIVILSFLEIVGNDGDHPVAAGGHPCGDPHAEIVDPIRRDGILYAAAVHSGAFTIPYLGGAFYLGAVVPVPVRGSKIRKHGGRYVHKYPRCRCLADVPDVVDAPYIHRRISFREVVDLRPGLRDESAVQCSRTINSPEIISGEARGGILHLVPCDVHFSLVRILGLPILEIVRMTQEVQGRIGGLGVDLYRDRQIRYGYPRIGNILDAEYILLQRVGDVPRPDRY